MESKVITINKGTFFDGLTEKKDQQDNPYNNNEFNPAKLIHGAIDFKPEGVALGFRFIVEGEDGPEDQIFHIIGDQNGFRVKIGSQTLFLGDEKYLFYGSAFPPLVQDRWNLGLIRSFVEQPLCPEGLYDRIKSALKGYLELPSDAYYGLVAVWIIATYFAHAFPAFSFLLFCGPKESGKSKALEMLELMSFNSAKVQEITVAALGDTTDGMRGTLLIDQAESLKQGLVGLLADSYKRAGAKRRIISSRKGKRVIREFSAYGPKVFASTKPLHADLADRCCCIAMQRSINAMPDLMGNEPQWAEIRDACYRFLLLKWTEVLDVFNSIPSNGTRRGELWRPLQAVLSVLGVSEEETQGVKQSFELGTAQTKYQLSLREEALFQVLLDHEDQPRFELTTTEILNQMEPLLDQHEQPKPQWVGRTIKLFALAQRANRRTRFKRVHYDFNAERVRDVARRYLKDESVGTESCS